MNAMPGRLPLHILVIEDDADTCENLRDILELDGHTVTFALSAADAMQHPHLSDVDVVLLDWKLPDATALELLPRIKESAVQAEVIIVTGHSDFEMAVSALRQGAADYLLKPINPQALRTSLQRIAEQQRLAQEKAESDAMFRGLVEAAPVLIVIVRPDLTIEYFSPFAEQLTGYRAEEIRHANFGTVFLTETHRQEAAGNVAQMLQGQPVEGYENTIRCADGTIRWMVWNARLLTNLHGAPAILAIGQDVTEHKAAIERLVQSERLAAIGEAMTGLAHESRNALQRSQAFLELLSLEVGAQPDALKLVGQIQEAQNHLHQLYEEVREYAAPLKPNRRVQSPAPVIQKTWEQLICLHPERAVRFEFQDHCREIQCPIDEFMIHQVFRNIFENSLAACTDPTVIEVNCERLENGREPPRLRISIRDNGPGLTAEQRKRMFDPFFTTKMRGTGLGMTICRRIIDAHGGTIDIGAGPGTEILLTLPLSE